MKRKIEKRKKIEAAAAVIAVVLALFIVGSVPVIIADTSGPDDPVYDGTVTVILNATDNDSGVASTHYAVNPTEEPIPWIEYTGPFNVSEPGNYTVFFYSVDNAGNEEIPQTKSFVIYEEPPDVTPPVTSIELQGQLHQP